MKNALEFYVCIDVEKISINKLTLIKTQEMSYRGRESNEKCIGIKGRAFEIRLAVIEMHWRKLNLERA